MWTLYMVSRSKYMRALRTSDKVWHRLRDPSRTWCWKWIGVGTFSDIWKRRAYRICISGTGILYLHTRLTVYRYRSRKQNWARGRRVFNLGTMAVIRKFPIIFSTVILYSINSSYRYQNMKRVWCSSVRVLCWGGDVNTSEKNCWSALEHTRVDLLVVLSQGSRSHRMSSVLSCYLRLPSSRSIIVLMKPVPPCVGPARRLSHS